MLRLRPISCAYPWISRLEEGKCHSCHKDLRNLDVTVDEFNQLSAHFCEKALIGGNIFYKSTPLEVEAFMAFIDKTKPFDCVIDGLNVAYTKSQPNLNNVCDVINHFVEQKKTVLVILPKHMERSPKAYMDYIRRHSHLVLTDDLTQDDPFFIYAALKSGPNTDIVTRDLIRNHTFKLDKNLKIIFRRWQLQHQYKIRRIDDNGRVFFMKRIEFDMNAHQINGWWHIPYADYDAYCTIPEHTLELRVNWLCVSIGRS